MELTHEIIDMTYKFARTFLKRIGRTDIETHDLAHDALLKIARASEVEPRFLRHRVWLDVKSVFYEFYTNTTSRKRNVLLDAVHAEFDMETRDPDTVDVTDEFARAFQIVHHGNPTLGEILTLIIKGLTVPEIAKMRNTSTQAVYELQTKARNAIAAALGMAA